MRKLGKLLLIFMVVSALTITPALAATTVTMYAPNQQTIQIWDYEVPAYQNVGWYTYPVTLMKTVDGRECVISTSAVFDWYRVGWNSISFPHSYLPDYGNFNKITCSYVFASDKGAGMTYAYNYNHKWNYIDLLKSLGYELYEVQLYSLTYYNYKYNQIVMISNNEAYTNLTITYLFN